MPTSPARIEANRRNARCSTGPRTPAGKLVASGNALRHGLLSQGPLVRDEDSTEFEAFRQAMHAQLQPLGPLEEVLVERIIGTAWRLGRVARIEAGLLDWRTCDLVAGQAHKAAQYLRDMADPGATRPDKRCHLKDRPYHRLEEPALDAGEKLRSDVITFARAFVTGSAEVATLIRYETSLERGLHRALHELQRLQAARAGQFVPPPAVLDIQIGDAILRNEPNDPHLAAAAPKRSPSQNAVLRTAS